MFGRATITLGIGPHSSLLRFASHLAQTMQPQQIDSRSSVVEPDDQTVSARSVRQRVVFAVEVVHERVDDGEVEQIEVETTLVVRLHRALNLLAVRPVVEPVLRPPQHRYITQCIHAIKQYD